MRPSSGTIRSGARTSGRDLEFRRAIGYISHQLFLYPELTGRENLRFFARLYGRPDDPAALDETLAGMGLAVAADRPVRTYSRGMKQRLAIARAPCTGRSWCCWTSPSPAWTSMPRPSSGTCSAGSRGGPDGPDDQPPTGARRRARRPGPRAGQRPDPRQCGRGRGGTGPAAGALPRRGRHGGVEHPAPRRLGGLEGPPPGAAHPPEFSDHLLFAFIIIVVFNFAFDPGSRAARESAPAILWVAFLFAGILSSANAFAMEREEGCMLGPLLAPGAARRDLPGEISGQPGVPDRRGDADPAHFRRLLQRPSPAAFCRSCWWCCW